jgi:hypothetical protein
MDRLEPNSKTEGYRRRQRVILPLAVILMAVLFTFWTSRREAAICQTLQEHVYDVCTAIMAGEDPSGRILADSDAKREGYVQTLRKALGTTPAAASLHVEVVTGDTSRYADGRGTHTALISIERRAILGVRIQWRNDETHQIIGYWVVDQG